MEKWFKMLYYNSYNNNNNTWNDIWWLSELVVGHESLVVLESPRKCIENFQTKNSLFCFSLAVTRFSGWNSRQFFHLKQLWKLFIFFFVITVDMITGVWDFLFERSNIFEDTCFHWPKIASLGVKMSLNI